jgi:hypothetical protein
VIASKRPMAANSRPIRGTGVVAGLGHTARALPRCSQLAHRAFGARAARLGVARPGLASQLASMVSNPAALEQAVALVAAARALVLVHLPGHPYPLRRTPLGTPVDRQYKWRRRCR